VIIVFMFLIATWVCRVDFFRRLAGLDPREVLVYSLEDTKQLTYLLRPTYLITYLIACLLA